LINAAVLGAVKIVARFYMVQCEHIKRDVVGYIFVANFLRYVSAKN